MKKFYISTAIDYPSAPAHLGHVYEKVCADVIARWQRKKGKDVFFSTGTDEHGQKIQRYALKSNEKPQDFVDKMSEKFISLWKKLNISYDRFIRTTQTRHIETVRAIFEKIYQNGDIYKGMYEGLYCVDCETFYTETDLKLGLCPVHNKKVEKLKEESYFFKMSKYQQKILDHIEGNHDFIQPQTRRNEIINRIKEGIRDLSISRSGFDWGIPLPINKRHVLFVWLDALINYISVLDYPETKFSQYWPADIHLIGKDILWFHAVVWPAILLAADIELPGKIFVHGFINIKGEKISKSKGVIIDPVELLERYDADALRYFLLREIPFGEDGNFSEPALIKRINSDLANDLGNLLHRSLTMIEKHFQGVLPNPGSVESFDEPLISQAQELPKKYSRAMDRLEFGLALDATWSLINAANKYIEDAQPWNLAKQNNSARLAAVIYNLAEILRIVAIAISPFMPTKAEQMWQQLGIPQDFSALCFSDMDTWGAFPAGTKVNKTEPLFPRIQ